MQKIIRSIFVLFLPGFFTVASAQLPPEIMVDKHLIQAEQLHAAEDYAEAFKVMGKIIVLQKEHNLTLPDEFHFKYAQVALSADSTRIALESVNKYLSATGREGEFYKEALALLLEAEGTQISAEETCVGKPEGAECWKELANQPECYVWDDYYYEDQTVTWSGKCSGNLARGTGTLSWEMRDKDGEHAWGSSMETGDLKNGKKHGQWVYRSLWNAEIGEGPYVDGKEHGQWIYRNPGGHSGAINEGPYVNGKPHGQWIWRYSDGRVWERFYVNGKEHGQWVTRHPNGYKSKGEYINGSREGTWFVYDSDFDSCTAYIYRQNNRVESKKVNKQMCR